MKVFSEEAVRLKTLTDVRCNKCGRPIGKNDFGYYEDHVSFNKTWGYHSPIDGETHEFDVCINCYLEWTQAFKIPPDMKDQT